MEEKKREIIRLMDGMKEEDLDFLIACIKRKKIKDIAIDIKPPEELLDIWKEVLSLIERELTELSFNTWFKPIVPIETEDNTMALSIPNQFHLDIIEKRYSKLLKNALYYVTDRNWELKYNVIENHRI